MGSIQPVIAGATALGTSTTAGLPAIKGGVGQVQSGLGTVKGGVGQVQAGLQASLDTDIATLVATIQGLPDCGSAACDIYVAALLDSATDPALPGVPAGTQSLRQKVTAANSGLLAVLAGIGAANDTSSATLNGGLNQVSGGLDLAISRVNNELVPALTKLRTGMLTLRAGLTNADANGGVSNPRCSSTAATGTTGYCGLTEGLAQLVSGVTTAVSGIGQLAPGSAAANVGAGDLADGIAKAGNGVVQLAGGAAQLSDGLDQVAAKVPDAVTGAQTLATGSAALADGSAELAAGLSGKLAPGANQLADGLAGLQAAADGRCRSPRA